MARTHSSNTTARRSVRTKQLPRPLSATRVLAAVKVMSEPAGTSRFAAGKAISLTTEDHPARVYPHFAQLAELLNSDSKIVRWNAMQILSRLAPVDRNRKLDAVVGPFLKFIRGNDLITAANAIQGLGRIARARPDLVGRIATGVLAVEKATYATPECRNVAIGHALNVFRDLWPSLRDRRRVVEFVRRQRGNTRRAVAQLAEQLSSDRA